MDILKTCSKCGETKSINEFSVRKDTKSGYRAACKECLEKYRRNYYSVNAERIKTNQRKWNATHKELKKISSRKWHIENLDKARANGKKWALANPDKIKAMGKRWRENNPEKANEISKRWKEKHPEKAKEINRKGSLKIWNSKNGRLNGIMSSAIRRSLKGAKARNHWENIVGYSLNDLKCHLEHKFKPDMSWDNQGKVWEIDHIIPLKYFNFKSSKQIAFKEAWALSNLQPLYKLENRRKSAKLTKPLQLILPI
jgi:hypothetical protein